MTPPARLLGPLVLVSPAARVMLRKNNVGPAASARPRIPEGSKPDLKSARPGVSYRARPAGAVDKISLDGRGVTKTARMGSFLLAPCSLLTCRGVLDPRRSQMAQGLNDINSPRTQGTCCQGLSGNRLLAEFLRKGIRHLANRAGSVLPTARKQVQSAGPVVCR